MFKTVRMKDHILEWEKLTGQSFDSLKGAEREAVIDEAVRQANEAIFDYSKVPNFLRQIRRYPLGAPFITFTYKSFPQIIRSVARRPQKFIKYAALPMIMHHMFLAMNPDLDDDDFEQIQRDLPLQMKEKSSVYVLPVKDDNGNWQYIPLGYYLPWAPFHESAMNMMNNIDTDSAAGMLNSTYSSVLDTLDNFGFLGGPVPQLVTAFSSGIDSFTGRPIVEEGASPQRKLAQRLTWTWGLAAPSWLTNYGVLGKVLDNAEISLLPGGRAESTDALGRDKETGFQV
ncbi:MAG: hypothetical protein GTO02_21705 [Candidatus Dadabacteria bacterium]|nr:hypothetical protein [Candidatus Dadabacteria bacterium]